jgi:formate dehydrogenase iron-sulfur subunit
MPSASLVRLPLIEHYLREQRSATPVEKFALLHGAGKVALTGRHRESVALEALGPGHQLAFEVDLDACTGCKACVTACHSMNGLDEDEAETWRAVGVLQGGTSAAPVKQSITTACHHCVDPACMTGCPVNAYEKDPVTGIVRHLDDQCIGCQYCTLTCPYEVPQYNSRLGIVRKCDMCSGRLAAGEAPACVQACPNEAIAIRIVSIAGVIEEAQVGAFLPGAASPAITIPTTSYVSRRSFPRNTLPADFYSVRGSNAHWPLAVMLVLTQWSVGMFVAEVMLPKVDAMPPTMGSHAYRSIVAAVVGLVALLASVLHLGRPRHALRALVGLRTSWLSREILAFGVFACLAVVYAGISAWSSFPGMRVGLEPRFATMLASLVVATGAVGVLCSVLLYAATRRQLWTFARTSFRFATTVVLAGASSALAMRAAENVSDLGQQAGPLTTMALSLAAVAGGKLLWELALLSHLRVKQLGELKRSAVLVWGELRPLFIHRVALGFFGAIGLPLVVAVMLDRPAPVAPMVVAATLLGSCLVLGGELLERSLFFRSVSTPTMPGNIGR